MTHALDMGCGKLRYAVHLAEIAKQLTVVDSEIQMDRVQLLFDKRTTIKAYALEQWQHVRAMSTEEFAADRHRYDFALCANVLSAIPSNRARLDLIQSVRRRLTARGKALFVCQYTNSYFFEQMRSNNVLRHRDGFIKGTEQNASFYGLITPEQLVSLVSKSGLVVEKMWRNDQSGYVISILDR